MARDGSGNFTLPANTQAVSGDPISSTKYNTLVQDLEADANTDRPIVAGGTGASTAAAARTNLGVAIGTDVQAYDAGLLSIAGLTTLADRGIYTTASDTYAVYTLTAAGRAILDDADAAAQRTTLGLSNLATVTASAFALTILDDLDAAAVRTTIGAGSGDMLKSENLSGLANYTTARTNLGLGTAAVVNTGTSGGTVPLLNAANTFGTTQVFSLTNAGGAAQGLRVANTSGASSSSADLSLDPGNSGFNTRDVILRGTNNGSNQITFSVLQANGGAPATTLSITSAGVATMVGNTIWHAGNDGAGSGLDADTLDGVQGSAYATLAGTQTFTGAKDFTGGLQLSGVDVVNLSATQTLTNKTLTSPTINGGTSSTRTIASSETTGTLTVASANETIQATGDITIPNAVFAAGDIILIYAGASARTITQGASVTMRLGGTATTGSRTLAARGVAMLFFVSASEVVVSGGAVT